MEELEKTPTGNLTETEKEKEAKPKTLTLEDVANQNKELNDKLEKVLKQNSDKDSFISQVTGENKELRDTLQKLSGALQGKSEKQQDADIEHAVTELVGDGYDEKTVRKLINIQTTIARKSAEKQIATIIMDATEGLVESDPEIDKEFMEKNSNAIKQEFDTYKPEASPRKIKANLKKAYNKVKSDLADKAKAGTMQEDEKKRQDMLPGGAPPQKGAKEEAKDDLLDRIDKAGPKSGHFI